MANKLYSDGYLNWFDKMGQSRPFHADHHSAEDISKVIQKAECKNWRMEGNELIADTQFGPLRQKIPTGYICVGEEDGLPQLKKVVIS